MTTPRQAAAWNAVIDALCVAIRNYNLSQRYVQLPEEPSEDDMGMWQASDDDLYAWMDDLESRIGLDTEAMRAAMEDYCDARRVVDDDDRSNGPR